MSKKKIETYSQCRFTREGENGARLETVAYIDAKEAHVGKRMSFKGSEDAIWTVILAGAPGPKPLHTTMGNMD